MKRDAADAEERTQDAATRRRNRRAAAREIRAVLSERRAIAAVAGFVLSGKVAFYGLLVGDLPLTIGFGALAYVFMCVMCRHMEEPTPRPPKGETAKLSHAEFERMVLDVEREAELLARGCATVPAERDAARAAGDDGFAALVAQALDDLPAFVRAELDRNVAVTIADDGHTYGKHGYYGLYHGATAANDGWARNIVLFRDTLVRDFGDDPELLRERVTMVVRHEVAHHLGASERHVAEIGLSDTRRSRAARPAGSWSAIRPPSAISADGATCARRHAQRRARLHLAMPPARETTAHADAEPPRPSLPCVLETTATTRRRVRYSVRERHPRPHRTRPPPRCLHASPASDPASRSVGVLGR